MLRKLLTILSLIGLLLSVGLWGVSFFGLQYQKIAASSGATTVGFTHLSLVDGLIVILRQRMEQSTAEPDATPVPTSLDEWQFGAKWIPKFVQARHKWLPTWEVSGEIRRTPLGLVGERAIIITAPLYVFVVLTGAYPAYLLTPLRRSRRKLGLCLQCGYDLRGSKDICPECGQEFQASESSVSSLGSDES